MVRYEMIISWSDADQAFVAEVPELPGCAADGATYQEALSNAEVIVRELSLRHQSDAPRPEGRPTEQTQPA
jgi:predicted RNase H-like HicB family nuclease